MYNHEAFNESDFLFDDNITTCKTMNVGEEMMEHVLYVEPYCTVNTSVSAVGVASENKESTT